MIKKQFSSLTISIGMLLAIMIIGTVGYVFIESYTLLDAVFMTIITVSTVGFSEVKPLTPLGELFTIFMIIFSFGAFAYAVTSITRFIVDGGFRNYFINKRTARKTGKIANHVIICGYGRNGREAATTLQKKGEKFVIIENKPELIDEIRTVLKVLYVEGDATDDDVLKEAGIERAKALITTLPNDADNLLVVLSARTIDKNVQLISRASFEWSDIKLRRAGATNVIMPDLVGGRRMAKLVAQPDIISFLDYMLQKQEGEVQLLQLKCHDFAKGYHQKTIGELKFKKISGVNIIGLKDETGQYIFNPDPDMPLLPNYRLFVMATAEQFQKLKAAVYE